MSSVTQRIKEIKQPKGGYLNIKNFEVTTFSDNFTLEKENINPSTVGLAVDYLTRFMLEGDIQKAFEISIMGAFLVGQLQNAAILLNNIYGLDSRSISCACKMCGYDVAFRSGVQHFNGVNHINPDNDTINNIRIMVLRSINFAERFGPITKYGFTFDGGYTHTINAGDGDFLTKDTLWDFKVSRKEPTSKYTLQILIYYIMGKHSAFRYYDDIKNIGLFNPRLNKMYIYNMENIDENIIREIEKDIICY